MLGKEQGKERKKKQKKKQACLYITRIVCMPKRMTKCFDKCHNVLPALLVEPKRHCLAWEKYNLGGRGRGGGGGGGGGERFDAHVKWIPNYLFSLLPKAITKLIGVFSKSF